MKKAVVAITIILIACIIAGIIQIQHLPTLRKLESTTKPPMTWVLLDN